MVWADQAPAGHRAGTGIEQGHTPVGAAVEEGPRRSSEGMAEQDRLTEQGEGQAGAGGQLAGHGQGVPKAVGIALALGASQPG